MAIITDIGLKREYRHPRGTPMCLSVKDVAFEMTLSEAKVYDLLRKKQLPSVRAGKRWLVPREAFQEWMNTNTKKSVYFIK